MGAIINVKYIKNNEEVPYIHMLGGKDFHKNYLVRYNGYYMGEYGTVIESPKGGPGMGFYHVAVIKPNGDLFFGDEQGNYVGGIVVDDSLVALERYKGSDPRFHSLIMYEYNRLGLEPSTPQRIKENLREMGV